MMLLFWVEFWAAMLRPAPTHTATVVDLAKWRRDHPKRGAA